MTSKQFEVSGYEALTSGFVVTDAFTLRLRGESIERDGMPFEAAELISGAIAADGNRPVGELLLRTRWVDSFDGGVVLYALSDGKLSNVGWFVGRLVERDSSTDG